MAVTLPARLPDDTTDSDLDPSYPELDDEEPERDSFSLLTFLAVIGVTSLVVILCVLGAAFTGLFNFGDEPTGSENVVVNNAERVPATSMEDGQWLVGTDIRPGTYSVTVMDGSAGCAWERNSSTDGTAASVLESGIGEEGDTITVEIQETDVIFQSRGCGHWERVETQPSD